MTIAKEQNAIETKYIQAKKKMTIHKRQSTDLSNQHIHSLFYLIIFIFTFLASTAFVFSLFIFSYLCTLFLNCILLFICFCILYLFSFCHIYCLVIHVAKRIQITDELPNTRDRPIIGIPIIGIG